MGRWWNHGRSSGGMISGNWSEVNRALPGSTPFHDQSAKREKLSENAAPHHPSYADRCLLNRFEPGRHTDRANASGDWLIIF